MMVGFQLRQFLRAPLTLILLGVLIAIEVLKQLVVADPSGLYSVLGLSRGGIGSLSLWQWLSYGLIHGSWAHLAMNGLLLLAVGSRLEWMVGRRPMVLLLLAGVLGGGLFHLALSADVLIGASGGMLALWLCHTTLSPESRWLVPFPVSGKNLGLGLLSASLILTLLAPSLELPLLAKWGHALVDAGLNSLFEISHPCHLGGALVGWLGGRWLLRPRVSLASLQRDRARREAPDPDRS